MQILQELSGDGKARRLAFCQDELARIAADPGHLQFLVFSDEAIFHLDGRVNKHNSRYWSKENPHWHQEETAHTKKITVWCGIWREGIVGPFFFENSVNGESYLQMLREEFLPELEQLHMQKENCIFQQDGAPPHYASTVRAWLDGTFPSRWMGRASSTMPWPPRSPDLTICDFFVWGFIKSKVYIGRIASTSDLKARIEKAFLLISDRMRFAAFKEYSRRLRRCVELRGGHVELR